MYKTIEIYMRATSKTDEKLNSILQAVLFLDISSVHRQNQLLSLVAYMQHVNAHICTSVTLMSQHHFWNGHSLTALLRWITAGFCLFFFFFQNLEDSMVRSDALLPHMYLIATIHESKTFYIIYKMFIRIIAFVVVTTFPVQRFVPEKTFFCAISDTGSE